MYNSRRNFLFKTALAATGVSAAMDAFAKSKLQRSATVQSTAGDFSINIFSKNMHWLDYSSMATLVRSIGFDGIDLTVRPEGHVVPEQVADDLPKAIEIIRKQGLEVKMITTAITSATEKYTESILKTAGLLGIGYYRMGWIPYDDKFSVADNMKRIQEQMNQLAVLNKKYSIRGQYQNHSGINFGAPLWDLASVLRAIDSPWIGSQYDIMHATVEGANAWPLGFKLLKPYIGTMDIKDFLWKKKDGKWTAENVPLGEGMVDLKKYFALLKENNVRGPLSLHYEYPLGGVENGTKTLTIPKEQVVDAMKKDLATLRSMLSEAGLSIR